jgi:Flp pilus assembly protein TadD
MALLFVAAAARVPDPALQRGAYPVGDQRAHHYGSMPYAQAEALVAQLRAGRDAATDPAQRALLSARLSDVFAARQRFDDAKREIDEALRLAPDAAPVLVRAALVEHALGDEAAAEALLRRAEAVDAADPQVAGARAFLSGVTPPSSASAVPSE